MNDIKPPRKRPLNPAAVQARPSITPVKSMPVDSVQAPPPSIKLPMPVRRNLLKRVGIIVAGILILIIVAAFVTYSWYQSQLGPMDSANHTKTKVVIASGMGPNAIGALLQRDGLIHSQLVFDWYTRLTHTGNILQAGTYSLSPDMSLPTIIDRLKSGKTDNISITFLPGATVAEDKKVLEKAGFSSSEIDAAFTKSYSSPLFVSKPASADLEGYIYGETYSFPADVSVETILTRTFDEYYTIITQNNLEALYAQHGLTLYQGITLASIIQREVARPDDMKQVAQVFYLRLQKGISLGSDVTYQYVADKMGVPRDPNLDSPYNTRVHTGLPPGPISSPGKDALLAVAYPAPGDYLFFLSGDDDKTYFATTQAEHEQNIQNHCQQKCKIL